MCPSSTVADQQSQDSPATHPDVSQLQLDNGLQSVWETDSRQPLVAIEARIKGGMRAEGKLLGTGVTHFIEHMLFKGTTSRVPGTIDQEVRRYGGSINAFTSMDTTGVTLFVESKYLKEALGMLADILQHAVFDQKEFDKERAVIISEIQMNLDDPDRRLSQMFWSRHYLEHPYRHPILGYQPLLEKLTVQDMAGIYAAEYQPQNITIACVGDIDGKKMPELFKEIFGQWARGTGDPLQQLIPTEPPAATAKTVSLQLPVQAAYALVGFSSVRLSDPDVYPLDVLASILGRGQSSRLYETLVRREEKAYSIASWNYTPYDPGIFGISLRTDPEKVEPAIEGAKKLIESIKTQGVSPAEVEKAKRQVTADYLFGLQTIEAKAGDLANSLSSTGDPLFSRKYVERIARVSAADVQRAARQYCTFETMTQAVIFPDKNIALEKNIPVKTASITTKKTVLANGATALLGVDRSLPIVGVVVAFHGGVRVETDETQGLSNLVAQMLARGTKHHSAVEIAQIVESWGGTLAPFSGRDGFGIMLQVLASDAPSAIALAHEMVTESIFDDKELAIQKQLIVKDLQSQEDEIFEVGGRLLRKTLFGSHPYRLHPLGTAEKVASFNAQQCKAFARQWLVPSNMVVTVFGAVNEQAVDEQLKQTFARMPAQASAWPQQLKEDSLTQILEAKGTMDRAQALIMLGFRGTSLKGQERQALDIVASVLSGMAGRLFQSVREKHGLSYTLGASHVPGWDPGYLLVYAATKPEEQTKVLSLLNEQLQLAVADGFTQEEVDQAKRYLIGQHRMDLQHLVGLAKRATLDELYGLGFDAWRTYENEVNAVTVPMVNQAARHYITMNQRAQVVISPNGHAHQNN